MDNFQAPISFFDITPIGRILNRFSSDLYSVDDSLPFVLNILLAVLYGLTGTVIITCYGLPWFALVLVPLAIVYYFLQVREGSTEEQSLLVTESGREGMSVL